MKSHHRISLAISLLLNEPINLGSPLIRLVYIILDLPLQVFLELVDLRLHALLLVTGLGRVFESHVLFNLLFDLLHLLELL